MYLCTRYVPRYAYLCTCPHVVGRYAGTEVQVQRFRYRTSVRIEQETNIMEIIPALALAAYTLAALALTLAIDLAMKRLDR